MTKIFRFQAAHAIYGYPGQCSNLHGHSYALHVTVSGEMQTGDYLAPPGFILDFKELKHIVKYTVVDKLDHHTILSKDYLAARPSLADLADALVWEVEPTAENMLIYIRNTLRNELPSGRKIVICRRRLFITIKSTNVL